MNRNLMAAGLACFLATAGPCLLAADPAEQTPPGAPVTNPALVSEQYRRTLSRPEYQDNLGPDANAQVRDWLSRWFTRLDQDFNEFQYSGEMPRFASLLMTFFVVLSLGGLLYTVVRLVRRRSQWDEPGVTETAAQRTFRAPEFYEEELRRAVAAGDWHEAWLASWRQFLSRLEHGRMVEADRSRTNREYLSQLRAQPLPAAAESLLPQLVDAYDNFIYGRKPIGEPEWHFFQQQVNEAALMLHLGEKAGSPQATH